MVEKNLDKSVMHRARKEAEAAAEKNIKVLEQGQSAKRTKNAGSAQ